jgi:hypothetical protein
MYGRISLIVRSLQWCLSGQILPTRR